MNRQKNAWKHWCYPHTKMRRSNIGVIKVCNRGCVIKSKCICSYQGFQNTVFHKKKKIKSMIKRFIKLYRFLVFTKYCKFKRWTNEYKEQFENLKKKWLGEISICVKTLRCIRLLTRKIRWKYEKSILSSNFFSLLGFLLKNNNNEIHVREESIHFHFSCLNHHTCTCSLPHIDKSERRKFSYQGHRIHHKVST